MQERYRTPNSRREALKKGISDTIPTLATEDFNIEKAMEFLGFRVDRHSLRPKLFKNESTLKFGLYELTNEQGESTKIIPVYRGRPLIDNPSIAGVFTQTKKNLDTCTYMLDINANEGFMILEDNKARKPKIEDLEFFYKILARIEKQRRQSLN